MSAIPSMDELAALQGNDIQFQAETFAELQYLIALLNRAVKAVDLSKRALQARHVSISYQQFDAVIVAIDGLYLSAMPVVLEHAVARDAGKGAK